MIKVFIDTKKRANEFAAYTAPDGTRYPRVPKQLLETAQEAAPPADYSEDTYSRQEIIDPPYVVYTPRSADEIQQIKIKRFTAAMEDLYDRVAQAKQYDNRYTCALRAGYVSPFQTEGIAFAGWMDNCNAYGYAEMAKVLAGTRPEPTVAEFLAELPPPPWPVPEQLP